MSAASDPAMGLGLRTFFDEATNTVSYLAWDPATLRGAVIDPVLDWDNRSGEADTRAADAVLAAARQTGVTLDWVLETHVHADHLTASPYIKARTGARIGIGEGIRAVQTIFRPVFEAHDLLPDGGDFDHLFTDNEEFRIGSLPVRVLHVPGHTPACVAYVVAATPAVAFIGDTLFMPDYGTARCDFPGGDARVLWRSIHRLLRCRRRPGCSPATTTRRPVVTISLGRARWPNSAPAIRTSRMAAPRTNSSRCARRAMRSCRRRCCCCPPSR